MVAMVADLPMGAPGASLDAPLMMRRETTLLSHKAKRGLRCHPGKPLGGIWLKREQTMLGTDHHIVSLIAILNVRDDMNRLARELGCRTRAGSREGGLGGTTGRLGLLGRSRRDDWLLPVLRDEARESSHLLLQGVQPLGQGEQRRGQGWPRAGNGHRWLRWGRRQAALMPAGESLQVLIAHPFFAAILGTTV